ncbi:MAG: CHAT domain-containing tetratricopeptide repeat protein [Acidobacteriota bacterium]|nr:CHAT domain-containing tetratricopeptide repeat protein [Acidobacteriota bacterium]
MLVSLSPRMVFRFCQLACSIVLIMFLLRAAFGQEAASLTSGQNIEKNLSGGETHNYQISLKAGQFIRLSAEQRGLDVKIRLAGKDGKQLVEVDLIPEMAANESACWISETDATYLIAISASEKNARGRYALRLEGPRTSTEQDRSLFAGQQAFYQAEELFADNKPESRRKAAEKYSEAAERWRAAEFKTAEALALYNAGDTYNRLREFPKALDALNQALQLQRAANNRSAEAATLNNLGTVYSAMNDKPKAVELFNQSLTLRREVKDAAGEAVTLGNLAATYSDLGERRKALEAHKQVLAMRRSANNRRGEALTLNNIGSTYLGLGEKRKAVDHFQQALKLWRALNDRASEALTLNNLGAAYSDLGDQQKALDAYNQSIRLRRAGNDTRGEAITAVNLARSYDILGASQEAITTYSQSLTALRAAKDRRWEGITLNYLGLAHWASGEYQQALVAFEQALPIRRELKDTAGEAAILNNIGLAQDSLGDRQKALEAYNQALPLLRTVGDKQGEARTLNNIGFAYDALNNKTQALESHQQALKLSREVGDRMREAKVRYGIARIESGRNNLRQSRSQIQEAIKIVESLRANLSSPELRASYRASVQQYYDLHIDVLMRMGKRAPKSGLVAEALQVSERARARSLIELLTESSAEIRQGVDPTLVERERELHEQINEKTTEQIRLLGKRSQAGQVAELGKEIEQLNAELRTTQAEIRNSSPRYAALTQPQPLTLSEIQKQVLNPWSLLLEYSLGEERSYLWVVGQNSIQSFTLPKRSVIEAAAKRFYEATTARNQFVPRETAQQKLDRIAAADAESQKAAAALSRIVLAPAATLLGNKRLIVIADGGLQYVPFSALPVNPQSAIRNPQSVKPLVSRHEIVAAPSATTLAVLRTETANQPKAAKTIAVIADPVFEAKDDRVKVFTIKADTKPAEAKNDKAVATTENDPSRILLVKSAKDTGSADAELRVPRLPNTRREADAILSLTKTDTSKAAFDFAANRSAATGDDLSQYRILHFATHGFLNSLNPELSGLVMSLVDEQGKPQNGYLLAPEIYNLKLPATELVVLSACQTGLGKEVRGEGIVGLTRGFMYAGSPRVVVSLWNVNDRATAELMKSFYEAMLAKGQRPAAALRAAQLELLKQKQWQAPYFWAAFGLQGEWR